MTQLARVQRVLLDVPVLPLRAVNQLDSRSLCPRRVARELIQQAYDVNSLTDGELRNTNGIR